jgi:DNA-binding winged helix-turn-helix (wHTH) protein
MTTENIARKLRFGPFEVDLHCGELRKQGLKIRIQPQPLKVLAMLVEHPGELVSRDDLRERLWPKDVYMDFEQGLNRSMYKLRCALLDTANSPRYIETLPGRGYRFIATVVWLSPNSSLLRFIQRLCVPYTAFRPDTQEPNSGNRKSQG